MSLLKMADIDLKGKRVLIREDFNVPMDNGTITSDARIKAAIPTIEAAKRAGAKIILLSHLGRPEEGTFDPAFSLAPVAQRLQELLGQPVRLVKDWLNNLSLSDNEIVLCENVRFLSGEKNNDQQLAKQMASLCDVFIMDAFATAHRAEASTTGIANYAPVVCAGPLLSVEIEALTKALQNPARPLVAIVGGSKVSTKLMVLENLLQKVDQLIVGGGIANTFMAAEGYAVGKSLYEKDLIKEAQKLLSLAKSRGVLLQLPLDVVVAESFSPDATPQIKLISEIQADEMILDIGPQTALNYTAALQQAGTVIWNGPVGVFEFASFAAGTQALATAIAESSAFSLAGGGDTLAAIEKFNINGKVSYISTGGGAFLEFIEGKTLPAVAILESRGKN